MPNIIFDPEVAKLLRDALINPHEAKRKQKEEFAPMIKKAREKLEKWKGGTFTHFQSYSEVSWDDSTKKYRITDYHFDEDSLKAVIRAVVVYDDHTWQCRNICGKVVEAKIEVWDIKRKEDPGDLIACYGKVI